MTTLNTMVKRVAGLLDTKEVSEWENDFIRSIVDKTKGGEDTRPLSERQAEVLERLFKKHFAG